MKRTSCLRGCGLVLLAAAASVGLAMAQTVTGTIVGTAMDQSGAVLPGVNVTVTNAATSIAKSAVTNDAGQYAVPFLQPGTYSVYVNPAQICNAWTGNFSLRLWFIPADAAGEQVR